MSQFSAIIGLTLLAQGQALDEAQSISPPVASLTAPAIPLAQVQKALSGEDLEQSKSIARARVTDAYSKLEKLGYLTGLGLIAENPLVVNGQPVMVVLVGDRHNESGQQANSKLLEEVKRELSIDTLVCEGKAQSEDDESRAKHLIKKFEDESAELALSDQQSEDCGIAHDLAPTSDYGATNYEGVGFSRIIGGEGKAEDLYFQALRLYHKLAVDSLLEELKRGDNALISVDERYVDQATARLFAAQVILKEKYEDQFPEFNIAQAKTATLSGTPDGREHPLVLYTERKQVLLCKTCVRGISSAKRLPGVPGGAACNKGHVMGLIAGEDKYTQREKLKSRLGFFH